MDINELFKKIILESPVGVVILDQDMKIRFSNRMFRALISEVTELKGYDLSGLIHPDDVLKFKNDFGALISNEKTDSAAVYRFIKDMEKIGWIRVRISSVQSDEGGNIYVTAFIEDITAQREYEIKLKEEKGVAERSSRIKSDFLANMSHEIRTPIHTITGMSELLSETKLDKEQQEYSQQIEYSADVLLGLINDILDFSKIEAGKLHLEKIDFDLFEIVENAVDMIALEAHKRGLETGILIENDVPFNLKGDPVRLRQIIVNLFNNAVKFTHEGSIQVRISLLNETDEAVKLKFGVIDTGIGISAEKKDRLFKVFSQVDSSTTRKYGGTGLGLSISKNLAEMMGGEIGVESEHGIGSTFWFSASFEKQPNRGQNPYLFSQASARILLVDDNREIRGFLRHYLEGAGFTVLEVSDGKQALEFLRERSDSADQVDLCLIDLILPGMDGWQLASEIHSDEKISGVRRILLSPTGKSAEEAKMKLLNWFDGYLHKPVKKRLFLGEIIRVLNQDVQDVEEIGEAEELEEVLELIEEPSAAEILVAEDHAVNQVLFKTILENLGHKVEIANNGVEAVKAASAKTYDIIFMDVQMPEMNGYEATGEIRKAGCKTPIIAVTASAIKGEREKCLNSGMTDFLTKPFKKKDIIPVLEKWYLRKESVVPQGNPPSGNVPSIKDIFDLDQAVEVFMGKKDVVINLINNMIPNVDKQLKQMGQYVEAEDFDLLRADAHSIKGGSSNLYINRVSDAAKELELASAERSENCGVLLEKLKSEFETFKKIKADIIG